MNKAILFAVLAFVAVAAANPRYGVYQTAASVGNSAPVYSAPSYAAPAYSAPVTNSGSSAAAVAASASSAPGSLLYNVPSYSLGSKYALGGYGNGPSY